MELQDAESKSSDDFFVAVEHGQVSLLKGASNERPSQLKRAHSSPDLKKRPTVSFDVGGKLNIVVDDETNDGTEIQDPDNSGAYRSEDRTSTVSSLNRQQAEKFSDVHAAVQRKAVVGPHLVQRESVGPLKPVMIDFTAPRASSVSMIYDGSEKAPLSAFEERYRKNISYDAFEDSQKCFVHSNTIDSTLQKTSTTDVYRVYAEVAESDLHKSLQAHNSSDLSRMPWLNPPGTGLGSVSFHTGLAGPSAPQYGISDMCGSNMLEEDSGAYNHEIFPGAEGGARGNDGELMQNFPREVLVPREASRGLFAQAGRWGEAATGALFRPTGHKMRGILSGARLPGTQYPRRMVNFEGSSADIMRVGESSVSPVASSYTHSSRSHHSLPENPGKLTSCRPKPQPL